MISNITSNNAQESHFSTTAHLNKILNVEEPQNYLNKDWHPDDPKYAYIKNGHMTLNRVDNQSEAIWMNDPKLTSRESYTFHGHLKAADPGRDIPPNCLSTLVIHIKYKDTTNQELEKTITVNPKKDGSFKVNGNINAIGIENKIDDGPNPDPSIKVDIDQLILTNK